ncbi:hypothetical protein IAQ61_005305 [Plenodomus lingam]|uniref:Uncharacterized protein n=1 Tax=Leptosphaeria maculans (strain JN3 / isolate v23.1.3 / race Av1-4-5-6-7-8) TaxID=985895 RepID=E5A742_LEPMJ|nr:predicted protein [Plenodomus lingam JN3]KAH9872469.1 hypothetical protein IAQ61_005305 [Plenodomus lingam]CBX99437.1 predicted protein [Plenodomus lingam JN3]
MRVSLALLFSSFIIATSATGTGPDCAPVGKACGQIGSGPYVNCCECNSGSGFLLGCVYDSDKSKGDFSRGKCRDSSIKCT